MLLAFLCLNMLLVLIWCYHHIRSSRKKGIEKMHDAIRRYPEPKPVWTHAHINELEGILQDIARKHWLSTADVWTLVDVDVSVLLTQPHKRT